MSRILSSLTAAAVVLGCIGSAMAQQPSYLDRAATSPDRSSASDRNTTYPSTDRYATYPRRDTGYNDRDTMRRDRYGSERTTTMPERQSRERQAAMARGQFASEAEARASCRGDTVVWANTKSHVYHLPGTPAFGHTKRGAFMCQADADRSGTFRAAKNEKPARSFSGSSSVPR